MNRSAKRVSRRCLAFANLLYLLLNLAAAPALADTASPWVRSAQSSVRLVSALEGAGDRTRLPLGLEIALEPGWKTYWRTPGDAGLPANIDLSGSVNAERPVLRWVVPHRFQLFGLQTFGYSEHVLLPFDVDVPRPGQPVSIKAHARYLVCEVICIPEEARLSLDLPAGPARPSAEAPLINQFASLVPGSPERVGWRLSPPGLAEDGAIVIEAASQWQPFHAPDVIVEHSPTHVFAPAETNLSADGRSVRLILRGEKIADGLALDQQELVFTVFDGTRAAEFSARPVSLGSAGAIGVTGGVLAILAIALLGGLILNVMPCVLPVLVLKLTSVLELSGQARRQLRLSFLATAFGILVSFLVLAGALSTAKEMGAAIGWGIQFQQPAFLAVMALVCLGFAANLFGLFEMPALAFAGRASLAADRRFDHPYAKAFFAGVLATALATPCSAPFVGAAIGFALSRGPVEIFSIFAVMALGLASPYLLIAAAPGLVRVLPRPGSWMVWLRRLLGVSLLGTAVWLGSIIGGQLGWVQTWVASRADGKWVTFQEAEIDNLVQDNRVVFVDVTADWCLTCQANKKLVLEREPVAGLMAKDSLVAMRADWTNPDPEIANFLARFGRFGIPFNIVFGPGAPSGIVLPELLTAESVTQAIAQAGGP